MSTYLKTSHSRVQAWRKCHYLHFLRYVLKLRPKKKPRPLMFGSIVHSMIEAHANGDDAFTVLDTIAKEQGKLFRTEREEYGELVEDIRDIMTDYFAYWGERSLTYVRMKGKASELSFEVEVSPGIKAIGKIDNIAKTPNKLLWITEHKTGRAPFNEDHRWRSLQSALYVRIVDMIGLKPVDGTLWDWLKSKPPSRPQILKSGAMSQRGIDSLPTRVTKTLLAEGLKPGDFPTLLKSAISNQSQYFQRVFSPVKKKVVDLLFSDFVMSSRQIADYGEKWKDKTIDRHCDWCSYEPICRAELRGNDVDFIQRTEFEISEGHDFDADFEA